MRKVLALLGVALLASFGAEAAPCCGGGQGAGTAITGDENARFRYTQSASSAAGRSIEFGEAVKSQHRDLRTGGAFSLAQAFNDRWQAALAGGWAQNTSDHYGIKDTAVNTTYVLHRNYLYSNWMPEVFLSLGLSLPSGTSFYEDRAKATDDALLKSRAALLVAKTYMRWDWSVAFGYAHARATHFASSALMFRKGDSWNGELTLGYSPTFAPDLHIAVTPAIEHSRPNRITRDGGLTQLSLPVYVFPWTMTAAYAVDDSLALALGFTTTELFQSQNSELSDTLSLTVTYRLL